jgi:hypothetical protein
VGADGGGPVRPRSPQPPAWARASDDLELPDGTPYTIDVDLNNDGDFLDAGELDYTDGTLTDGQDFFDITPALAVGSYKGRARVTDLAGNQGSSAVVPFTITASAGTWDIADVTRTVDPLRGDAYLQEGDVEVVHQLRMELNCHW